MTSKRTNSTSIAKCVKDAVAARDSIQGCPCCIYCGKPNAKSDAHYIPRSHGGLGIEENILTLCWECHMKYDQSTNRENMRILFCEYLMNNYAEWEESSLVYRKGENI